MTRSDALRAARLIAALDGLEQLCAQMADRPLAAVPAILFDGNCLIRVPVDREVFLRLAPILRDLMEADLRALGVEPTRAADGESAEAAPLPRPGRILSPQPVLRRRTQEA